MGNLSITSHTFVESRVANAAADGKFTAEEAKTLLGQFREETDSPEQRALILKTVGEKYPGLAEFLKKNDFDGASGDFVPADQKEVMSDAKVKSLEAKGLSDLNRKPESKPWYKF